MADFDRLDKAVEAVKNAQVPAGPSQDLASRTLVQLGTAIQEHEEVGQQRRWTRWAPFARPLWPVAAAAALVLAGFLAGRLTQANTLSQRDLAVLERSLEGRLRDAVASDLQAAQTQAYHRLMSDVNEVLDRRISLVAGGVLAASNTTTNQVIRDLVQVIRANQIQQHNEFAAALEWIEADRMRKQAQLSNSFASFAVATEHNLRQTTDYLALLAGRQGTDGLPSETHQPSSQERN